MMNIQIGLIGIAVLFLLIFLRAHIGFALALVGIAGFAILVNIDGALSMSELTPFRLVTDYNMAVIPLFVFMGAIAANTGISGDLYKSAYSWFGQYRGGLSMATIAACGGFAAVTGSGTAATAAMGKVAVPEMTKYNYDPKLTTGSVAAGGTIGILIPPSVGFILYALLTEQSIGQLFMAGIFPGITEILFYMGTIYILCRLNPLMGPAGPKVSFKAKILSLKNTWQMLALFVLVMGGIYGGIFTPTEAGGIGAFGALAIGLSTRRLSRQGLFNAITETAQVNAMILIILLGATFFSTFLAASQLPFMLSEAVSNLAIPSYLVLALILIVYIILGCVFDIYTTIVLTVPIFFPVILALGFNPIWYGVLMVRVVEIGMITPPIGLNCYILAGTVNVPVGTIFRGILPFFIADILNLAILVAIPQISLFLPNVMLGG
jgi:C4-dicarboxylate transporter DctM subunit